MIRRTILALLSLILLSPDARCEVFREQTNIHLGVVLPLKEQSPRGPKMVEFYQGVLLAADSLRRCGVSIDIEAYDCGRTLEAMDSLLASNSLALCDIVIGPLDAVQVMPLADYCNLHGIRLVQPFATVTSLTTGHPLQYVATAPRDTIQADAVDFVRRELSGRNYILVDTHEQNEEGVALANSLRYNLSRDGAFLRLLDIDGGEMDFFQAFNELRSNLVILNSPSLKALNKFLPKLRQYQREHPDCAISLLGYPSWQTFAAQLNRDFHQFDTFVYTPFYRDATRGETSAFEAEFERWFHHPMANTFPRYAMMGFDLAYFFMHGLSLCGTQFERKLGELYVRPLQNPLRFVRTDRESGYVNHAVQFVHYTRDNVVEVLMRTE